MGRDFDVFLGVVEIDAISIHSPRVGRDETQVAGVSMLRTFQSTRPVWGETLPTLLSAPITTFQSTRPVWGETEKQSPYTKMAQFQSTRPVWGETSV